MMRNNIDLRTLKILYEKYRDYLLPLGIIFISFVLFTRVVTPQINDLLNLQRETKKEQEKLSQLLDNLNLLTTLNESLLDSQLSVSSDTLPANKDFAAILNAVSASSDKVGVFLGDFEFQVGDISKPSTVISGLPTLQLDLNVTGSVNGIIRFVDELYRTVPVSQVSSIEFGNNRATLTVVFYYKAFAPVKFRDDTRLELVSQKKANLVSQIQSWNNPKLFQAPVATSGASISPF